MSSDFKITKYIDVFVLLFWEDFTRQILFIHLHHVYINFLKTYLKHLLHAVEPRGSEKN